MIRWIPWLQITMWKEQPVKCCSVRFQLRNNFRTFHVCPWVFAVLYPLQASKNEVQTFPNYFTVINHIHLYICNSVFSAYELVVAVLSLSFWNAKPKIENSATPWLLDLCLSHWLHYREKVKHRAHCTLPGSPQPKRIQRKQPPSPPPSIRSLIPNPPKAFFIPDACIALGLLGLVVLESTVSQRNQDMKLSSKKTRPQ